MTDDVELKNNIKRRGVCKARLTTFGKYLNSLRDGNLTEISPVKLTDLESRVNKLPDIFAEFESIQTYIDLHHDNFDEQLAERESFENTYFNLLANAKYLLEEHEPRQNYLKSASHSGSNDGNSEVSVCSGTGLHTRPKLPSIPLPKFSGGFDKWMEFRDTFKSLVHDSKNLSNIEKLHFLRGCLEGSARDVLVNIEITSANYDIAWEILCERYNNKSILVDNCLKALLGLPSFAKESSSDVRKLLNGITKGIRSLKALNIPVDSWDLIIIHIMCGKLDSATSREWYEHRSKNNLPTLDEFQLFLKSKAEVLETLEAGAKGNKTFIKPKHNSSFVVSIESCPVCDKNHSLLNCKEFLKLRTYDRYIKIKSLGLCLNCLKPNHLSKDCHSSGCRKCSNRHHTLLHYTKNTSNKQDSNLDGSEGLRANGEITENNVVNTSSLVMSSQLDTLLSTALVQVVDSVGNWHICRALLDSGSQSNLVTAKFCKLLKIKKEEIHLSMVGINQTCSSITEKCLIKLQSLHNGFEKTISCLVVPQIIHSIPNRKLNVSHLNIPRHIKLADPDYSTPGPVDLLLGADPFYQLLCIGQFNLGPNQPTMQKTRLGWIISGNLMSNLVNPIGINLTICNLNLNLDLKDQLEKFWSVEEPPNSLKPILSTDEKECETIFINNVSRNECGRFIVQIPLKQSPLVLGDSSIAAKRQFFAVERKLLKNPKMRELYNNFMLEYESMGHMSLETDLTSTASYFLPHHGVLNESSSTTRLRVVFNGSCPTDNGISFNDIQYVGPNVQDDILSVLLRFRLHNIVVCADIAKMYRMILVQEDQRCLQKIFWRAQPTDKLNIYKLNTVTYGTASASYLAIRCLKQLGLECKEMHPEASNIILHNFFVDDMLFGADTVDKAVTLSSEVFNILQSGCFLLRKWISNSPEVLRRIIGNNNSESYDDENVILGDKSENKILGLHWSVGSDVLKYHVKIPLWDTKKITKRSILSAIAKIYDPLGLISPSIIPAKIILQKLWCEKIGWDESLPSHIFSLWQKMSQQLDTLNELSIPRQMVCKNIESIEIHGFCDSSIEAYGACIYLKSINTVGETNISLVFAKAKVTPLKVVTLPRLELCGALVLAQLINTFKQFVTLEYPTKTFLWTDSTVVLGWLAQSPHCLQTFVGNRVSQIQTLTSIDDWRHVCSKDNPADLLSRGVYAQQLISCDHWWNGPKWLVQNCSEWPKPIIQIDLLPEMKRQVNVCQVVPEMFPMNRFSNFSRLKRSFSYLWRFYSNCRTEKTLRNTGHLLASELNSAVERLLIISQMESFSKEYSILLKGDSIKMGPLSTLNPYIDSRGVLRVGGRLQLSGLDYAKKHPAVLLCKHHFSKLLFLSEHALLLHAGPQHLLASLREHYWPIGGRNLARSIVRKCMTCFRVKPKSLEQIMGSLPKGRVTPNPPFHTTGIDYAGPFNLKTKNGRGAKIFKGYVCLFICFSTRAIHLEVVSELTTAAFISTFQRFVSRRGRPACVWSDNGLNFVGANTELKELSKFLQKHSSDLEGVFENEGINWRFIPARSPNFGGSWEAGVKACKFHMKRIMGNASLTFENFYTLLTQIEATLNSRPLIALSPDPSDYDVLTPSHFLIGKRLTALPNADLREIPENRLSRFQHIQKMNQHFWTRWSKEYIILLQQRLKWKYPQRNLQVGDLVIIREDNQPPLHWKLGRVNALHLGADKQCRVVTVKTSSGELRRSVRKLCLLPLEDCNM